MNRLGTTLVPRKSRKGIPSELLHQVEERVKVKAFEAKSRDTTKITVMFSCRVNGMIPPFEIICTCVGGCYGHEISISNLLVFVDPNTYEQ